MRHYREFAPTEVVHRVIGLPAESGPSWSRLGTTKSLPGGLFFSFASIRPDRYCPDGLFETGSAVDVDADAAEARACLECLERYALGAWGWHEDAFEEGTPTITWAGTFSPPYGYSRKGPCVAGVSGERLSVGDVFAPYDAARGHCGVVPSTNGAALGSSLNDAVARARGELIERDAIMRAWYLGAPLEALGAPAEPSPAARSLEHLGYEIVRLCLTRGPSGNTVLVLASNHGGDYPVVVAGAAHRSDVEHALAAAELEVVQSLVASVEQARSYRQWMKAGMPLDTLAGHMYAAASGLTRRSLATFIERARARPTGPSAIEGGVWAEVDVTPPPMRPWLRVARSVNSAALPIVVGEHVGPAELLRSRDRLAGPHPFP